MHPNSGLGPYLTLNHTRQSEGGGRERCRRRATATARARQAAPRRAQCIRALCPFAAAHTRTASLSSCPPGVCVSSEGREGRRTGGRARAAAWLAVGEPETPTTRPLGGGRRRDDARALVCGARGTPAREVGGRGGRGGRAAQGRLRSRVRGAEGDARWAPRCDGDGCICCSGGGSGGAALADALGGCGGRPRRAGPRRWSRSWRSWWWPRWQGWKGEQERRRRCAAAAGQGHGAARCRFAPRVGTDGVRWAREGQR